MIGTFEALRAPLFLPAQRHAAMGAGVEQYSDTAVIAPHDQTGILLRIATDKIARTGNFAFVRDRQPGPGARKSVVEGQSVVGRVELGGGSIVKKPQNDNVNAT